MTVSAAALTPARPGADERWAETDKLDPTRFDETASSKGDPRAPAPRRTRSARTGGLTRLPDGRPDHRALDAIEHANDDSDVAAIIDRWRSGDALAFAELYIHFFARVERYLAIAMKDHDDAAEAAQEVFLKVLEALPRYDASQGAFRDWLFRIVRNQAIDHHRRGHRSQPTDPAAIAHRRETDTHQRAASPSDGIGPMVDALPLAQQRILTLRYVYDYRFGEIADIVDMTPEAVRRAHMRALRVLAPHCSSR